MDGHAAGRDQRVPAGLQNLRFGHGTVGCLPAVFFVLGGLINPEDYGEVAERQSRFARISASGCSRTATSSISRTGSNPTSWPGCSGSTGKGQIGSFRVVEPLGTGRQRDYARGRRMRTKANMATATATKNEIEPATKKYLSISVILVSSRYSS